MLSMVLTRRKRIGRGIGRVATALIAATSWSHPAFAGNGLLEEGFEAFTGVPAHAAEQISDGELDELRGGYFDMFFAVTFSAFVESEGVVDGSLDVDVAFNGQNGTLSFENADGTPAAIEGGSIGGNAVVVRDNATNEAIHVQAGIGDAFNGARGAFQITQVPGNGNAISTMLNIDVVILEATQQNIDTLRGRLLSLQRR
jgi:hypothetical protein